MCRVPVYFAAMAAAIVAASWGATEARAQRAPLHYFHRADMPPGSIGRSQLLRGGPLPGHFQAVEVYGPEGTLVSLAVDGFFQPAQRTSARAGMLIGSVYRFKVSNIPGREGAEIFPTIEVLNRLHPPPGVSATYPIPIELTQQDLELAIDGALVMRVIYLEDPERAQPFPSDRRQRFFDAGENEDPLQAADAAGRPMAILRMGSRVPPMNQVTGQFLFDSPPIQLLASDESITTPDPATPIDSAVPEVPDASSTIAPPQINGGPSVEEANTTNSPRSRQTVLEAFRGNIPRVPLPPGGFTSGERLPPTMRR